MFKGVEKLYSGDFNSMLQEWQPDGSVIITLKADGEHLAYRFKVRELYGQHEELVDHQVIPIGPPQWVNDRMKEAKKHGPKT